MAATAKEVRDLTTQDVSGPASDLPDSRALTVAELYSPPAWLGAVFRRLTELTELHDNWDSHGGRRIKLSSLSLAYQVLSEPMFSALAAPVIVPTSVGGVQAEWRTDRGELEIEFGSDLSFEVLFCDADSEQEEEFSLNVDLTKLQPYIRELSR